VSPRDARPEDFEITESTEAEKITEPFNSQCGDSETEHKRLLEETSGASPSKPKFDRPR
jgi:hypothetical protein